MRLLKVDTVAAVKEKMDKYYSNIKVEYEEINITKALGRIAFEDMASRTEIPDFHRATVDGYAVVAKDTFGASETMPVFFEVIGKVEMGEATTLKVSSGRCVYVPTGGMIPEGADAMIMIEHTESIDDGLIAVHAAVAPGQDIIQVGDDVIKGQRIIKKGRIIKSQDVGVLCATGIERIKVSKKPRIAVISTGDEIVDPFGEIKPGQVRDINTYTLSAMAEELGSEVTCKSVIKDDFELLKKALKEAASGNDIVVISGGSSVGIKDNTEKVINSFGEPGVFVHGVAVKPGKPTILGRIGNTAVFGLPGHPVSAIIIFKIFVGYLINKLLGKDSTTIKIQGVMGANVHSSPGKETYLMVELEEQDDIYTAKPIYAKSAAISQLSRAHGFIRIPVNKEGVLKGETVMIELL
jgi:molybdopterin molybdotransferase